MHPTAIVRDRLALVVIDIQEKLAGVMDRRAEVDAAAARLLDVAGVLSTPVIVSRQYPKGLGDLTPVVAAAVERAGAAGAPISHSDKTAFCCCKEPSFIAALEETGRDQIALVGMETHICVAQTALALADLGKLVHVVADGVCSRRERDHDVALDRLRAAGVVVTTSEALMYEALGEAGTDEFKAVLRFVKES